MPLVQFAFSTRYAAGNGIHGHDQKAGVFLVKKAIVDRIVCDPLAVGSADIVSVDAYPRSDLLAVNFQSVVTCDDRDARFFALVNCCLRQSLIRDTGNDAGCIVSDRIIDIFQIFFRAHLSINIDEFTAVCLDLCLRCIAFIDEPCLVAGFVNAVYSAACEIIGDFSLGLACECAHAHCHQCCH